jgi:hypothetical protein
VIDEAGDLRSALCAHERTRQHELE